MHFVYDDVSKYISCIIVPPPPPHSPIIQEIHLLFVNQNFRLHNYLFF